MSDDDSSDDDTRTVEHRPDETVVAKEKATKG
jgi:hypothetical protein